jgi:hypothetical protein
MAIVSARMLAVVGLMLAAVAAYLYFPLTDDRRIRNRSAAVASEDRKPAREPAALPDAPSTTGGKQRYTARLPAEEPAGDTTAATGSALPTKIERLSERGTDEPAAPVTTTTSFPPWPGASRPRAQTPDAGQTASAAKPSAAVESEAAPAEAPPRFVAVVFTHQDQAAALEAFSDLRQRYPALLARRKAEAQPVEVADKGTWHRLVVLPAGTRQTAAGLCDRLQAAGYDRCWVKTY